MRLRRKGLSQSNKNVRVAIICRCFIKLFGSLALATTVLPTSIRLRVLRIVVMSSQCLPRSPFVLLGIVSGVLWNFVGSGHAQTISAAAGPYQSVPYDVQATAPLPYPSTSTPSHQGITPNLMASVPGNAAGGPPSASAGNLNLSTAPSNGSELLAPNTFDANASIERLPVSSEPWTWQLLPSGLMYKSYLAGNLEPRLGSQWVYKRNLGWRWDAALGGRVGLLRYGTDNDFWPEGWQLDVEGAAFPRLDMEHQRDLDTVDFRAGMPLTTRQGPWEFKFGYYHLSSHIGDEYQVRFPEYDRINYVRESLISGLAVYLNPSLRLYSEVGWCFYTDGGAKPWEVQCGMDFSPAESTGRYGAPFFAVNAHLRQENDFSGNITVQTGWGWRGRTGHLLRIGMQYFNGMSDQHQFYNQFEEQVGMGLWYDY